MACLPSIVSYDGVDHWVSINDIDRGVGAQYAIRGVHYYLHYNAGPCSYRFGKLVLRSDGLIELVCFPRVSGIYLGIPHCPTTILVFNPFEDDPAKLTNGINLCIDKSNARSDK